MALDPNDSDDAWRGLEAALRVYVRRHVAPSWVDDVVADVLIRLVRHRDHLDRAENPTAWLFRVAANAIADHHRRRAAERRGTANVGREPQPAATDPSGDDEERARAELGGCVLAMLAQLPPPYAEALRLTEVEGLTQTAAANRLGLSTSGMKSRVQRGRDKLKDELLRCCEVALDGRGQVMGYDRTGSCPTDCGPKR